MVSIWYLLGALSVGAVVLNEKVSRVAFVLLGIFLGIFGMHNFYAGYNKKAAIQLAITVMTCFYGAVISWIWAIVEVCVIGQDAEGEQFA